jgi:hypothetical protein
MRCVSWLLFLLALLVVSDTGAAGQQFRKPVYYGTGKDTNPNQVISAEFTSSGYVDLAVADYPGNTVSILLGNGDGTFQKPLRFLVSSPIGIAAGDMNGDGKPDLVVIESGGTGNSVLAVFLGNGDGTFRKAGTGQLGVYSANLTVADFNGDGHLDVAVANRGFDKPGSVMVFFGDGKGNLKDRATYKAAGGPWGIAAGDLNGDHHPDLAVALDLNGSVAVFLNDGTGKFLRPVTYNAGGGEVVDVKIGDLRHDGRNDLVVANASLSAIGVLLNTGNGAFAAVKLYPTSLPGDSTGADGVVIADFNLDGKLDLAASNQDGNSALFYGKGDGTFKAAVPIHDEIKFDGAFGLTVGDFNHDQAPDLAFVMYFKPKVAIMINTQ